ncbi:MAG: Cardiolipin synthase, ClsC, partial [uncultured Sphingomonadaceae bacterium]
DRRRPRRRRPRADRGGGQPAHLDHRRTRPAARPARPDRGGGVQPQARLLHLRRRPLRPRGARRAGRGARARGGGRAAGRRLRLERRRRRLFRAAARRRGRFLPLRADQGATLPDPQPPEVRHRRRAGRAHRRVQRGGRLFRRRAARPRRLARPRAADRRAGGGAAGAIFRRAARLDAGAARQGPRPERNPRSAQRAGRELALADGRADALLVGLGAGGEARHGARLAAVPRRRLFRAGPHLPPHHRRRGAARRGAGNHRRQFRQHGDDRRGAPYLSHAARLRRAHLRVPGGQAAHQAAGDRRRRLRRLGQLRPALHLPQLRDHGAGKGRALRGAGARLRRRRMRAEPGDHARILRKAAERRQRGALDVEPLARVRARLQREPAVEPGDRGI